MTYKIKKLDDFIETQIIHPRVIRIIEDRRWYLEDEHGNRLYGGRSKEDLERKLI